MKFAYILLLFFVNCTAGPVGGLLFTYNDYAGEINADTSIPVQAENIGCQYSILNLMSFGDSSAGEIASSKGIRRIATIDYSHLSIFTFAFIRNCTIVAGATY